MTTSHPTQCVACARFRGANGAGNLACDAYPGGIPNRISYFGADHRTAQKGDHGLQFEMKEGPEAQADFANWQFVYAHEEWEKANGNQEAGSEEGGDAA